MFGMSPYGSDMKKLLWLSFTALIVGLMARPIRDPDLWFHIVVGRWILSHATVPTQDYWNDFAVGKVWHAYSWSTEILFAVVERHWGIEGLFALQVSFVFLLVLLSAYYLGRIAENYALGAVLGAIVALGCYGYASLRPQMVTWMALVAVLWIAERIRREGWTAARGAQLAGLMCLWANSHLSAVIGVVAIGLWLWGQPSAVLAKALGFAFIGTLCTPYFGEEWLVAFQHAGHPLQYGLIAELKPATVLDYWTWPLIGVVSCFLYVNHLRPRILAPTSIALALGFFVVGLAIGRFVPYAVILITALTARIIRDGALHSGSMAQHFRPAYMAQFAVPVSVLCFTLGVGRLVRVAHVPLDLDLIPKVAVDLVEEAGLPHPILNSFGNGNYLIYRYSDQRGEPRFKVPLDGRTNVNSENVWEDFVAAFMGSDRWRDIIERVHPETIIWPTTSPFVRLLMASNEWCLVYQDGSVTGASVLVTRTYWEARGDLLSLNCLE